MKPNENELLDNLGKIAYTLDKAYISQLSQDYAALCFDEKYNQNEIIDYISNIRALRVDRWILDKNEKPADCFKNVLSLFADGDHTLALVVKRTSTGTEMYFIVKNEGLQRNEESRDNINLLFDSLKGNFPGTHISLVDASDTEDCLFGDLDINSISVLANSPTEYSEDYVSQGLDKLLNGIVPKNDDENYTVVFLAESLSLTNIREILSGYEDMATSLYPFLSYQFNTGSSEVSTKGEMQSIANTHSTSDSITKTHSINVGINGGYSRGRTNSTTKSFNMGLNGGANKGFSLLGASFGKSFGGSLGFGIAKTIAKTVTKSLGLSAGYGYSWGSTKTVSNGVTDTTGTSSSVSIGSDEHTNYTYKSYMVANLIEKLEKNMKKISESQSTGLWKFSTYVLSKESRTSKNVANYLRAVTEGHDSYIEPAAIQEWSKTTGSQNSNFDEIKDYVTHFTHPIFFTMTKKDVSDDSEDNLMFVTPTSYVGTTELSNVISFPKKSVQQLPVLECVQFGREPHSLIETTLDIAIGNAYHMREIDDKQKVQISKNELTKHTFITGSTGSGKSNTIYTLLEQLQEGESKTPFLVVEPAKGEYGKMLSKLGNITVYGTNPNLAKMLRINPFSFPRSIHVLEHLDRLVEIFNVCWPMYAAMPAILKDSIERAYMESGWNLKTSTNIYDTRIFPTFDDVLQQIKQVLQESDYSADNKGDYTGALVTRLKTMTNGLNGMIFTTNEIACADLFDKNVIVDLSRVGSSETKSLIMGLLILKLHEYRMDSVSEPNSSLRHITVIEEAHNLLKRTSTEQASESSNLIGKSVEMLANSIAEMRTYGEGFVIADQSPGLLDMSVIRNTNTKIIMRLPDLSDRELVGKAAGLNDEQITEVGRFEKGVASISQSDWLEPVLSKIFEYKPRKIKEDSVLPEDTDNLTVETEHSLLECIMNKEIYRKSDRIETLKNAVVTSTLSTSIKCNFINYLDSEKDNAIQSLQKLVYAFFEAEKAFASTTKYDNFDDWKKNIIANLSPSVKEYSESQIDIVLGLLLSEQVERDISYRNILCQLASKMQKEGVK